MSCFFLYHSADHPHLHSFPTRRSSDLDRLLLIVAHQHRIDAHTPGQKLLQPKHVPKQKLGHHARQRSEEHTSELQSQSNLVCRLLLEKKNTAHDTVFPLMPFAGEI